MGAAVGAPRRSARDFDVRPLAGGFHARLVAPDEEAKVARLNQTVGLSSYRPTDWFRLCGR